MEVLYTGIPATGPAPGQSQLPGKRRTASSTPGRWPGTSLRGQPTLLADKGRGYTARGGAHPTVTPDSKAALHGQLDSASEITRRQAPVTLQCLSRDFRKEAPRSRWIRAFGVQ